MPKEQNQEPQGEETYAASDGPNSAIKVDWTSSGRTGSVALTIHLASGVFTDSVNIVKAEQRERVFEKISDGLPDDVASLLRRRLDDIAVEVAEALASDSGGREKVADRLVEFVQSMEGVELFHVQGDVESGYITIPVEDYRDTYVVKSGACKVWLSGLCYKELGEAPVSGVVNEVITVLTAIALHDGDALELATRSAEYEGGIVIDLADAERQVVHVTREGWRLIPNTEVKVRFLRRDGAKPLPVPTRGGSVKSLRPLMNLSGPDQWVLLACTMVAYLWPRGPFPVLVISGEQGSAKSTLARMVQRFIDPNKGQLRRMPREVRDLLIGAKHARLLAYDNLSGIDANIADAICTLATGGGFAARKLYTDDEEMIFEVQRPVMLNGIDDLDERADLLDRSVVLQLQMIPDGERRDEEALWAEFEKAAPGVFGAFLDAVAAGLERRPQVRLRELPRMADFARTGAAVEVALGFAEGTFLAALQRNRQVTRLMALDQAPFALAVAALARQRRHWSGTASRLLQEVLTHAQLGATKHPSWPRSAAGVGRRIKRVTSALRSVGVEVTHGERASSRQRERIIQISVLPTMGSSDDSDQNRPTEFGPQGLETGVSDSSDGSDGLSREVPGAITAQGEPGSSGGPAHRAIHAREVSSGVRPNRPTPDEGEAGPPPGIGLYALNLGVSDSSDSSDSSDGLSREVPGDGHAPEEPESGAGPVPLGFPAQEVSPEVRPNRPNRPNRPTPRSARAGGQAGSRPDIAGQLGLFDGLRGGDA